MTETTSNSQRRREIVVVSHYFDRHGGGIERAVRHLLDELVTMGDFHFTWIASDEGGALPKSRLNPDEAAPNPADETNTAESAPDEIKSAAVSELTLLPMKNWNFLERFCGVPWPVWGWKSLMRMRAAIRHADLVWLHDALYMGNIAAFRMAQTAKKPTVLTQHIGTIPYRNPLLRGLMRLGDRLFTRRMLTRARQTVFISDRIAEAYHRQLIFKTPVMIVPNGVDPEVFSPAPAEQRWQLRARFALRDDQPILLFVGRFIEKKGLPVIRCLAELLPDWRFWLAGQGPIDPESWYQPNVHVFHDRSGASLAELYRAADFLILPSFGEGFPLVIQEAMACGLPVMCSPTTAAGSLLARSFLLTATVDPSSPERTAAIWAKRLKAQREFLPLARLNQDLANAAHYFWSWPKIASCYATIFNDLCGRRKK